MVCTLVLMILPTIIQCLKEQDLLDLQQLAKRITAVTKVIAEAATAITSALSSSVNTGQSPSHSISSPTQLIESQSKLYKQLTELHNLTSMGIMSGVEYTSEKETIMDLLKQLNARAKP